MADPEETTIPLALTVFTNNSTSTTTLSALFAATFSEALTSSTPSSSSSPSPFATSSTTFLLSDLSESTDNVLSSVNASGKSGDEEADPYQHDLSMTIAMTVIYVIITILGVLGNVATCVVIVRNRIMHTATNYYLFSMAVSDLLLLAFGMPDEIYMLWWGRPYIFGAQFCFIRGFTAEISTNASILTIAAFTVERYIGICHPLRSHTMSQLGRVIRSIALIWVVATACAIPIAIQYGIVYDNVDGKDIPSTATCHIKDRLQWVFEISSVLFFVAPMLLITVLYICIAIQLKRSTKLARSVPSIASHNCSSTNDGSRNKAVIKMLVAVVIAFFVCFAPHQAQRLMAIHADPNSEVAVKLFNILHNISGISYFISTCVNPILYHIMSNRFRQALQVTIEGCCGGGKSGASGGRWRERSQSARSQHTHTLELTENTFISEANTAITSSSILNIDSSSRLSKKTSIIQELNGIRKASGEKRFDASSQKHRVGISKFRPLFKPRFRSPEVIENPIDLFMATASPSSRKRSQSDSLLSGGSISNCSMTHVEPEFTQKELSEVMGRMKNLDV